MYEFQVIEKASINPWPRDIVAGTRRTNSKIPEAKTVPITASAPKGHNLGNRTTETTTRAKTTAATSQRVSSTPPTHKATPSKTCERVAFWRNW